MGQAHLSRVRRAGGRWALVAMGAAALAFGLLGVQRVEAASITVACNDVTGLRNAITAANSSPTPQTIYLASECVYTLTTADNTSTNGPNGLPVITNSKTVSIRGDDTTIARSTAGGTPAFRIMEVAAGGSLFLGDLFIQNGLTPDGGFAAASGAGGPGLDGGGVFNAGTLTMSGTYVLLNSTGKGGDSDPGQPGGNGGYGGGIFSSGTLTITKGGVTGNTTGNGGNAGSGGMCPCSGPQQLGSGGGDGGYGGGIYSSGNVTLVDTSVSSNVTGNGGTGTVSGLGGAGGSGGGVFQTGVVVGSTTTTPPPPPPSTSLNATLSVISSNTTGHGGDGGSGGNAGNGGGIANNNSVVKLSGGTVTGNVTGRGGNASGVDGLAGAGGNGAGIENSGSNAQLTVGGSHSSIAVISHNSTGGSGCGQCASISGFGGGLDNVGGAHAAISKTSFTSNTAIADGGAIFNDSTSSVVVNHVTYSGNLPDDGIS